MIDVRRLRLLVALERLGTIAAVAEELHLTAPGISMQLAALERELGVDVTERRGRRLALTPAGRLLAEHGRDVLERLSLADLEVDALRRGDSGCYRIAAFPSAARTLVADAWRELRAQGSGIELSLSTPEPEEALAALGAGEVDLAVVHAYSNVPRAVSGEVHVDHLVDEPVRLAIRGDDEAWADEVDLVALADHAWVVPTRDRTCFEMVDRACGLAGFRPRVTAESMDFAVLLELVAAGVGVALVPDLTVAAVPAGVRLVRPRGGLQRSISAVRRAASRTDAGLERLVPRLADAAARRVGTAAPETARPA